MNTTDNTNSNIGNNVMQNEDPLLIATNFVTFYYACIDQSPNGLIDRNGQFLYKKYSEYCIQGTIIKGQQNIFTRLSELHNRGSKHNVNSIDVLTSGSRRLNIMVTGKIELDGFIYNFTEYFHLASGKKEGEWWIQSNIIRTL